MPRDRNQLFAFPVFWKPGPPPYSIPTHLIVPHTPGTTRTDGMTSRQPVRGTTVQRSPTISRSRSLPGRAAILNPDQFLPRLLLISDEIKRRNRIEWPPTSHYVRSEQRYPRTGRRWSCFSENLLPSISYLGSANLILNEHKSKKIDECYNIPLLCLISINYRH